MLADVEDFDCGTCKSIVEVYKETFDGSGVYTDTVDFISVNEVNRVYENI